MATRFGVTMVASSTELRRDLVERLVATGMLRTEPVRAAFEAVPRERFVPLQAATRGLETIYADDVVVVKEQDGMPTSSSSQPAIMAAMLDALDVRAGQRVLEVGLGTGYNAALLSVLVGPDGDVTSVDIDETLVAAATQALGDGGYPVRTTTGDGRVGWPDEAPYDRVIITASGPEVHRAWWEQLTDDGRLVAPLRIGSLQIIAALARTGTGFTSTALIPGGFMPLRDGPDAAAVNEPVVTVRAILPGEPAVDRTVRGPGLTSLAATARQTLVSSLAAEPVRQSISSDGASDRDGDDDTDGNGGQCWPIIWQAVMTSDPDRQVMVYGSDEVGLGLVDDNGGCAALTTRYRNGDWSALSVVTYGAASTVRAALLDRAPAWRDAGSPPFSQLALEVTYDDAPTPRWALRTLAADDHKLSMGWRPALGAN